MDKIPSWIYIAVVAVISVGFIAVLVVARSDELNAAQQDMVEVAEGLDMDIEKFEQDLLSDAVVEEVDAHLAEAEALNVTGTPSVFINDVQYEFGQVATYETFKSVIENILATTDEADLPISIVTFEDYNCPSCARFEPVKYAMVDEFGDQIDLYSKHYPFLRDSSRTFAEAAEAARMQDKFDEFSQALFIRQHSADYENARQTVEAARAASTDINEVEFDTAL